MKKQIFDGMAVISSNISRSHFSFVFALLFSWLLVLNTVSNSSIPNVGKVVSCTSDPYKSSKVFKK